MYIGLGPLRDCLIGERGFWTQFLHRGESGDRSLRLHFLPSLKVASFTKIYSSPDAAARYSSFHRVAPIFLSDGSPVQPGKFVTHCTCLAVGKKNIKLRRGSRNCGELGWKNHLKPEYNRGTLSAPPDWSLFLSIG